jgi:hypothetical protein
MVLQIRIHKPAVICSCKHLASEHARINSAHLLRITLQRKYESSCALATVTGLRLVGWTDDGHFMCVQGLLRTRSCGSVAHRGLVVGGRQHGAHACAQDSREHAPPALTRIPVTI